MRKDLPRQTRLWLAASFLASWAPFSYGADDFIAGTEPSQRPTGAPVLTTLAKGADWYRTALTGITPPYPTSLRFLEDQGAWYTPFNRPGLTGPYDIRNWHRPITDGESRSVSGR